jgi:hypothetical protein
MFLVRRKRQLNLKRDQLNRRSLRINISNIYLNNNEVCTSIIKYDTFSEYDIFRIPPTQTTVELDKCSEHRQILTLSSKAFIEFNLTFAIDEYIVMNEIMLQFKMRVIIEKPLGAKLAHYDWKNVSTVNNLLVSLFKQVDLTIGDRKVTRSYQPYR